MDGTSLLSDRVRRNTQRDSIRVTTLRRPGTKTLGKVREESSFRSRSEKDSTRKGDLIAKARYQTPGRCRKSLRFDRGLRPGLGSIHFYQFQFNSNLEQNATSSIPIWRKMRLRQFQFNSIHLKKVNVQLQS